MSKRLFYILLLSFSFCLTTACSEEKEDKEEDKVKKVENEVKEVVMYFFTALENYNFNTAKELSTKASYSSVKFLDKISEDFNSCHFIEVKSCEVKKDKAICVCEFGYYGEESIEREVEVEKFEEEWLMNFQIGKNFDNIFVYDYGYELNVGIDDVEQLSLDPELEVVLNELIARLSSSYVKLGFSSSSNVASVDPAYDGGTTFGYSDYEAAGSVIHTSYNFSDEKLSSCIVTIDGRDSGLDMTQYLEGFYSLIENKLGKPFNLPDEFTNDPTQIWEMRWFIKSYNEVLILTPQESRIQLMILEIL